MDKLKDWSDEEISGLDMEAALALGMPPAKAARLCCRIRCVPSLDARRPLVRALVSRQLYDQAESTWLHLAGEHARVQVMLRVWSAMGES